MSGRIHLSAPDIGPLEESYVVRALRSGWAAPAGPDLDAFEREISERTGRRAAVALSSGTAALHLALLAAGVGPDTVVVVPTLTFVATANAVRYTGAEPVFVDCDPQTGNIDVALVEQVLAGRRRVAAVVPVDMFGCCVDYSALLPLCAAVSVPVVEDAAESLGASHQGRPAGSFGLAAALSFNGNKIITTSGGGMLLSDDLDLVRRCRYLASQARQPAHHYEHTETGYNYRLSNLLAALGRAQLRRLDEMIARRRRLRDRYAKIFAGIPGVRLLADADPGANSWLTVIVVDPEEAGWRARDLADHLGRANVETRPVWKPMHLQPAFHGSSAVLTGNAERLFAQGLTLPSGSCLTDAQVDQLTARIENFLDGR
ncbi:aminotransferase class I/II-fold pyridoxal phosphate-dependent enzyme [Micromonospora sp. NPDC050686]|uniref:DegT/DnrJ/EryC1/StrS family aminotransferase n=1 Tax=Micromonospora sp. NPDC050686 TaxID=3154631 RepID=UPI0033E8D4E7